MMDQLCEELLMELDAIKDPAARKEAVLRVLKKVLHQTAENSQRSSDQNSSPTTALNATDTPQHETPGSGVIHQPRGYPKLGERTPNEIPIQILQSIGKIRV